MPKPMTLDTHYSLSFAVEMSRVTGMVATTEDTQGSAHQNQMRRGGGGASQGMYVDVN
jgi:hypothetical protein